MARCEEAKKVKVRSVLGIHKQFEFLSLTTQIAVFQQPDMPMQRKKTSSHCKLTTNMS